MEMQINTGVRKIKVSQKSNLEISDQNESETK